MRIPLPFAFQRKRKLRALSKVHHFMVVILLLVFSGFSIYEKEDHAFTSLFTETFESDGNGTAYRANTFDDGDSDVWLRWDLATNPAGPNPRSTTSGRNFFQAYAGQQGNYAFGGEDMDATDNPLGVGKPGYIIFKTLDVSAYQSGTAKMELLIAASTELNSRYETADYIRIEYAFDTDIATGATSAGNVPDQANLETGAYSIGGAFYGGVGAVNTDYFEDTDLDGAGNADASTLTTTLTDFSFTFSIPASASTMSVRIVALGNSAEEAVVDNVRISAEPGISAPTSATIAASAFLEGAYNGTNLNTTLNASIPASQPYSINGHAAGETAGAMPAGAVDWVLVELREAGSAAAALNSTKVGSTAGFLMNDGSIKATDGTSDVTVSLSGNSGADFYVVIYHRNHLPIMSASAISESSSKYTIDFTSASANTFQTTIALVSLSGGKFGMPAGDSSGDGLIDATDLSTWRTNNGAVFSYSASGLADFNLDGVINAVDRNNFHQKNTTKTRQVPST